MICFRPGFLKKAALVFVLLFVNFSVLTAQEEEPEEKGSVFIESSRRFDYTYSLGAEYTYAIDLPLYNGIPYVESWQQSIKEISLKLLDPLGTRGHVFRIVNLFEWQKDALSFTAFVNATLNYIPAFFDTSLIWVPDCIKGGLACFKASLDVWGWAISDGWLLVNACTGFLIPVAASSICVIAGAACFAAVPLSVAFLAIPMVSLGGSIDYHPYYDDVFDTKLSVGLDLDGYRAMMNLGILGFFVQAQASADVKNVRFYSQAGYRLDFFNIFGAARTAGGTVKEGGEAKYVPGPYVKAGVVYRF